MNAVPHPLLSHKKGHQFLLLYYYFLTPEFNTQVPVLRKGTHTHTVQQSSGPKGIRYWMLSRLVLGLTVTDDGFTQLKLESQLLFTEAPIRYVHSKHYVFLLRNTKPLTFLARKDAPFPLTN